MRRRARRRRGSSGSFCRHRALIEYRELSSDQSHEAEPRGEKICAPAPGGLGEHTSERGPEYVGRRPGDVEQRETEALVEVGGLRAVREQRRAWYPVEAVEDRGRGDEQQIGPAAVCPGQGEGERDRRDQAGAHGGEPPVPVRP